VLKTELTALCEKAYKRRRDHEQDKIARPAPAARPEAGPGRAGFGRRGRIVGQAARL